MQPPISLDKDAQPQTNLSWPVAVEQGCLCAYQAATCLQVGGYKAQKSYVTTLSWASLPHQPPQDTPAQPHGQTLPQGRDQLLLFSGSSNGCVRLHAQSVESLGGAGMQCQGQLLQGNLMPSSKTLHPADLMGVTCLAVKRASSFQTGTPF